MGFSFFKNPKESRKSMTLLGPGHYETMSMKESKYASRRTAFISTTGVNKERMSYSLSPAPGPGTYRNNSI